MAGGDMRISNDVVPGMGQASQLEVIDANSVKAGDFSEERNVGGKSIYLTPEGAQAYDELAKQDGYQFSASEDPGFFKRFFFGDRTGPKGEQFQGRVK